MRAGTASMLAAAIAIAGCGDDGGGRYGTTRTTPAVPQLTTRVTELQTAIAVYCETRSSGSRSAADDRRAAANAEQLIRIVRRNRNARLGPDSRKTVRDTLEEVAIQLRSDCDHPPFERRVARALRSLQ